jgi:hypothetical protein
MARTCAFVPVLSPLWLSCPGRTLGPIEAVAGTPDLYLQVARDGLPEFHVRLPHGSAILDYPHGAREWSGSILLAYGTCFVRIDPLYLTVQLALLPQPFAAFRETPTGLVLEGAAQTYLCEADGPLLPHLPTVGTPPSPLPTSEVSALASLWSNITGYVAFFLILALASAPFWVPPRLANPRIPLILRAAYVVALVVGLACLAYLCFLLLYAVVSIRDDRRRKP